MLFKRIKKERLNYLNKEINLLNMSIHEEADMIVEGEEELTLEILEFKRAVRKFEKNTGVTLRIEHSYGEF